jgi:uncharacterized protein (DUF3820 family)
MDDYDLMPFGKYKGYELGDVPAEYLLNILRSGEATGQLKEYIEDVKEILEVEVQSKLN